MSSHEPFCVLLFQNGFYESRKELTKKNYGIVARCVRRPFMLWDDKKVENSFKRLAPDSHYKPTVHGSLRLRECFVVSSSFGAGLFAQNSKIRHDEVLESTKANFINRRVR